MLMLNFNYNPIMLTDNSTQSFIRKLCEREKEHSSKFYLESLKEKQNISRQSNTKSTNPPHKRMRTQSSSSVASTNASTEWALDVSAFEQQEMSELMDDWLCLPEGVFRFHKIYRQGDWETEICKRVASCEEKSNEQRKCIIIQINCLDKQVNFTSLLTQYSLPLLKFGKSSWSVAALSSNRRFDLLSLDCEGSPLWKAKQPLSKVQLQREQLLRRVFGYASEKEKNLSIQQILAKITLPSNNIVYFVLKRPQADQPVSKLFIQQQVIIEGITVFHKYSTVSLQPQFTFDASFPEALKKMGITLRRQEQLSKADKESFLKCVINKLEGQLSIQKQQLQQYIESQIIEQEQYPIPSERISMSEKYQQLQRNIKVNQNRT